jgi:hypothetical protein
MRRRRSRWAASRSETKPRTPQANAQGIRRHGATMGSGPPHAARSPSPRQVRMVRASHRRLPRRDSLVWLVVVPLVALTAATLAMWLLGVPGGDDPAHLYKVALLRGGESALWDNLWYAGSYGAVTYGILFYLLARWVPIGVLVVLGAGLLPLLFHLYLRRRWDIAGRGPGWVLAGVLIVYLAMGQSPFLVALALVMGGLVVLGSGRPVAAALLWSAAVFTNPLAIVAGGVFVFADLAGHRDARRPILTFALALLPAVGARVVLGMLFWAPQLEFRGVTTLARLLAFAALGVLLARASSAPSRRALQWVFAAYAAVVLVTFLVAALPVGSNMSRFFAVFGVPLLVAVAWPTRLPRWAPAALVVAALAIQLQFPLWQLREAERSWATQPSFYASALTLAAKYYDPDHRLHVVVPEGHWEAYYFPVAGFPITRGWFRQDDAAHNLALYDPALTPRDYARWLRQMGVRYVLVPHAPIVSASQREVALLETSASFRLVSYDQSWTVYRLRRSRPIVEPISSRATAQVVWLDHTSLRFRVSQAGEYRVRLTESPYWVLLRTEDMAPGSHRSATQGASAATLRRVDATATVRRDAHGMIVLRAPAGGVYTLSFDAGRTFADRLQSLRL